MKVEERGRERGDWLVESPSNTEVGERRRKRGIRIP
jgi:hypothetical protein